MLFKVTRCAAGRQPQVSYRDHEMLFSVVTCEAQFNSAIYLCTGGRWNPISCGWLSNKQYSVAIFLLAYYYLRWFTNGSWPDLMHRKVSFKSAISAQL